MSSAAQDTIRQVRRGLWVWGRKQADSSIKNRCRIVVRNLDRIVMEPSCAGRLRRVLACNVAELEELIRRFPHLVTRGPAARQVRIRRDADAVIVHNSGAAARPHLSEDRGQVGDWIAAINAIVPRGMPDRDDVRQDAFLAMFDGTAPDPKSAVHAATKVYNRIHGKWGPRSLDAPIKGADGLTLYDVIATAGGEGEDDE
jgi:hypothetical protein